MTYDVGVAESPVVYLRWPSFVVGLFTACYHGFLLLFIMTAKQADLPVADRHAERIRPAVKCVQGDVGSRVKAIMRTVFDDAIIQKNGEGAIIRYTSMCGEVIRRILQLEGLDPETIKILAIGDVALPPEAKKTMDEIMQEAHRYESILTESDYGYDLVSQGSESAREAFIKKIIDPYYGLSDFDGMESMIEQMGMESGGMRALDDLVSSFVLTTLRDNEKSSRPRFIQPDNSFGTWHQIVKNRSVDGRVADTHTIPTEQKNLLHLTAAQVDEFYAQHPVESGDKKFSDLWYITPVGNPSGTIIPPKHLAEVTQAIVRNNPDAIIVLDCVYVRTLRQEDAKELLRGVVSNPAVINRVLFIESLSKTEGVPGKRVGMYFSKNKDIFDKVLNLNMAIAAGNGYDKDALVLAVANATSEQKKVFEDLHEFWARERRGLFHYLRQSRFAHLFDEDQSHITPEQLAHPLGLYLFMKLKTSITYQDIALETGCLGVEDKGMGAGKFIRFSVGKIIEPTYASCLPEETSPEETILS